MGVGVGLTDCDDVVLDSLTTSGNAWAGVAVYTQGTYATGGSDGVTLQGSNSFSEPVNFYTETGGGYPITNLTVPLADFAVVTGFSTSPDVEVFVVDEATALLGIAASASPGDAWLLDRASGEYAVDPASSMNINPAIGNASSGDVINVYAGTIVEQVIIDGKDVTLIGSGAGVSLIHSPAVLASTFTTSASNKPVVSVLNTPDARIEGFTIDGLGNGNANNRFHGVAFWNGGGALIDCAVVDIRDTPFSGVQHGIGIYSFNDTGGPYAIEVGGVHGDGLSEERVCAVGATDWSWTSTTAR